MDVLEGGDVEALARQYGPHVFRAAFRVLGEASAAEDVQQEVFLRLLQSPQASVESWPAYLRAAATRAAIDVLRHRRRWHLALPQWLAIAPSEDVSAEHWSIESQQAEHMRRSLARLPKQQARCFALRYLEGLEIADIGRALAMTENNVSVALHRARKALEARLGHLENTP